ncbi:MAG: Ig-like domain-containing protein [Verrucomicrobiae bacterium]|nr:Ig-like domain-containing protein [Verrucomicrobiae bacterium]
MMISALVRKAIWHIFKSNTASKRLDMKRLMLFAAIILGFGLVPRTAFAQLTNATITIYTEGDNPSTHWTPIPGKVECTIVDTMPMTYAQWWSSYGYAEVGSPNFSQFVDRDATFYPIYNVLGFPTRGFPFPNRRDGFGFVAVKKSNDLCLVWVLASVGAVGFQGGASYDWHYQIRYFSGDFFTARPSYFEIGTVPNAGFYVKNESFAYVDVQLNSGAEVAGTEVVQSIQGLKNDVPLVEGKKTWVRVYLQSAVERDVIAKLRIHRKEGERLDNLGLIPASNPGGSAKAAPDVLTRRTNFLASLNFEIPVDWTRGTLNFQLEGGGLDCSQPTQVTFEKSSEMDFLFVLVNTPGASANEADAWVGAMRLNAMYPVKENGVKWKLTQMSVAAPPSTFNDLVLLNSRLNVLRNGGLSWRPRNRTICYGFLPLPVPPGGILGYADGVPGRVPGNVASGFSRPDPVDLLDPTLQHEIGHVLGRPHCVNPGLFGTDAWSRPQGACGEVADLGSEVYPYFFPADSTGRPRLWNQVSANPDPRDLYFGLDTHVTRRPRVIDPSKNFDLMSYCAVPNCGVNCNTGVWVSTHTYTKLMEAIRARFGTVSIAGGGEISEYLLVEGMVSLSDNAASFLEFRKVLSDDPEFPLPGDYILEVVDVANNILEQIPFQPTELVVENRAGGPQERLATFVIPVPANPLIRGVNLLKDGVLLASRVASENPPVVRVLTPNGGEVFDTANVTIEWEGTDADAEAIVYLVEYSADGGNTWDTLAAGLSSASYQIPRKFLTATTNALVRVVATDGFNSTYDESDDVFSVANNEPGAFLKSPEANDEFSEEQHVYLQAFVQDPEDGMLSGPNLQWYSDIDGALGSGDEVHFAAIRLSQGGHLITLVATDSDGLSTSNSVPIVVSRSCDFAISPTDRSIGPAGGNGSVSLLASNSCAWAASSTVSWIVITAGSNGSGDGMVNYSVAPNMDPTPREGTVNIAGKMFTVVQAGLICEFSITPGAESIAATGGTGSFSIIVASGCPWTATSSNEWLAITSVINGSGSGTVAYTASMNPNPTPRAGVIEVAGQVFSITQAAWCDYSIVPASRSFDAMATEGSVEVVATPGCAWTVNSSEVWLTITSVSGGIGNGLVEFTVQANPTTNSRTGTITIGEVEFTAVQAGIPCNYQIDPAYQIFGAAGGIGTMEVNVGTGCAWSAVTSDDWVMITSPSSGAGSSSIQYFILPNTNSAARAGTVNVGGQVLTIEQASAIGGEPIVTSTMPVFGATNVAVYAPVAATFNKNMDVSTLNSNTFRLWLGTNLVQGVVSFDTTNNRLEFTPSSMLEFRRVYTATIAAGVTDLEGNPLMQDYSWTFTTAGLYEPDYGDVILSGNDDGSIGPIELPFTVYIYGSQYTSFWINNNGNVTFTGPLETYTAFAFPNPDGTVIVAPFFGDVDTRPSESGLVHYWDLTNRVVVTWDRVGYYNSRIDKINHFQLILTAPGPLGNLIGFSYDELAWTTGDASGGSGGFGGSSARSGFDAGDGTNAVVLWSGNTPESLPDIAHQTFWFSTGASEPERLATLSLAPQLTTNVTGTVHTVMATALDTASGIPMTNQVVHFSVISGPNAGVLGTCSTANCFTAANGQVSWAYVGSSGLGMDIIQAVLDYNNNGVADSGEPRVLATNSWISGSSVALAVHANTSIELNRQTGLYEHWVKVTNTGDATVAGFQLLITGLSPNVYVYQASGTNASAVPYISYRQPLTPGSNVVLRIEYYSVDRSPPQPAVMMAEALSSPSPHPVTGTPFDVKAIRPLTDGAVLIEFETVPGLKYVVEYSENLVSWKQSLPPIVAPGRRLHWIDAGPPKTESAPGVTRYYRVLCLE